MFEPEPSITIIEGSGSSSDQDKFH